MIEWKKPELLNIDEVKEIRDPTINDELKGGTHCKPKSSLDCATTRKKTTRKPVKKSRPKREQLRTSTRNWLKGGGRRTQGRKQPPEKSRPNIKGDP